MSKLRDAKYIAPTRHLKNDSPKSRQQLDSYYTRPSSKRKFSIELPFTNSFLKSISNKETVLKSFEVTLTLNFRINAAPKNESNLSRG